MLPVSHRKGRYPGRAAASDNPSLHIRVAVVAAAAVREGGGPGGRGRVCGGTGVARLHAGAEGSR